MHKFGGKRDPRLVTEMIEALKDWLPEEEEMRGITDAYANGWNAYRKQILKNLK